MIKAIEKAQAEKVIGGAISGSGEVTLPNGNTIAGSGSASLSKNGEEVGSSSSKA